MPEFVRSGNGESPTAAVSQRDRYTMVCNGWLAIGRMLSSYVSMNERFFNVRSGLQNGGAWTNDLV